MLQALPFCCSLCPVATGYTLQHSLSAVPGCLGNGRLHQQWACTSVGADCLGNGRRPSPMELHFKKTSSPGVFGILFCLSHCATPNALSWAGSLFKSCSVSSSALSGLRLPVQQGTRNSALLCGPLWSGSALWCRPQLHRLLATPVKISVWCPAFVLYLGISPFCGQQRSVWKCVPDSPSPRIQREPQSWVVLTAPSWVISLK